MLVIITLFCRFYKLTCRNLPALEKIPPHPCSTKPGKFNNALHRGTFFIKLVAGEKTQLQITVSFSPNPNFK